ncbi:3-hydroxydecanoyl-ACP dehydratase [Alteromonas ponticola]|uniref:3-hydroxydecanoyl-ACP dehydratase n=1 Tax=Alteromonas ponticola TaxID=2720613 RepID=A0ABX1R6C0_9ALTE|nr:3-hydroxydecanoyl-ACP dehydratase [Alteromonas ponticola]NMH60667.1 3-hydroxydecanoyl-ACP dehydratase [Alteromonas ponticola]
MSGSNSHFDERVLELIPHRPPMLLINKLLKVTESSSSALVVIDSEASFFQADKGVPAWVGLEYMGQTAALIAGHQLQLGVVSPHLGFLLGTRTFTAECDYYETGKLKVSCREKAIVGDGLATFECLIETYPQDAQQAECLATATLSVFRRLLHEKV